ncbi:MAG TPA: 2-oxo acid dehydrogenase subunit E2, partial [Acidimicrobiales bacterium]|nr:2-oxo acid dehydrogenase subunit E2 [Acidimicrobiales bacterium]
NATLDEPAGEIVQRREYHLGLAAQTPEGLMVPVIRHADRRSLLDLAREVDRLGVAAKNGRVSPRDLGGSTFTITSLGTLGGIVATPIVNYPEVAILAIHKITKRPVVVDDKIVIRDMMNLSLSVDHRLVDGYDAATGVYEQFAGFHQLEPLVIAEVAPRRPIAADLLLGTARVHAAQVVKQADVLMLHHLVPDEVVPGSLEPNLRFYEPRTAHGSSLSPGVHASLFARAGRYERALDALAMAARVDLDDLTGTTAGGLHLAAMGTVWQALVFGFAGLRPHGDRLTIDPRLPASWAALEVTVRFHGSRVRTRVEHGRISVDTEGPVRVALDGEAYDVDGRLQLERRGHVWKEG